MIKSKIKGRLIGRYIVSDPEICHGKPTFRGTRIMVSHVLEMVAEGISWEAITEAVNLANQAFLEHAQEYTAPEYVLENAPL
jgi:uncharacterized protein (DUF433 family)